MPRFDWDSAPQADHFELPHRVGSGSRDVTMHRYLSSLRARGADEGQLMAAAESANAERFDPPLPASQVAAKVRSVMRYERGSGHVDATRPTRTAPRDVPVFDRDVPPSVLPDISDMPPVEQARAYLRAVFNTGMEDPEDEDLVCLCGVLDRPWTDVYEFAGTLCGLVPGHDPMREALESVGNAGLWCCVNPLTDTHRRKECVARYRNLLVECDTMPMDEQLPLILKCFWGVGDVLRAIVDSGNKSYHAIIRLEGDGEPLNEADYRMYAEYVYQMCEANGLEVDRQTGNPTRLTRMPGAMRAETGRMQRLVWAYGI